MVSRDTGSIGLPGFHSKGTLQPTGYESSSQHCRQEEEERRTGRKLKYNQGLLRRGEWMPQKMDSYPFHPWEQGANGGLWLTSGHTA